MRRNVPSRAQVQCWTVPRPAVGAEDGHAPASAQPDPRDPLHGYTIAELDDIARLVIRADRWHKAGDTRDRYEAARHGIIEHLLTTDQPPSKRDLVAAGMRAGDRHVREEMHHHGLSSDRTGETMPGFERYWVTGPAPSPEPGVVERETLARILPTLTPAQRKAVTALAWTEDQDTAAKACGVAPGTFRVQISTARRRFLALWHEGETPSGVWRTDRRVFERETPAGGFDARGRRRLTRPEVDALRERRDRGEATLTALAAEAGVHKSTLSALLRGRTRGAVEAVGAGSPVSFQEGAPA